MFRTVPLSIIRSFSLYTQQWYMSYRFADSLRAGSGCFVYKNMVKTDRVLLNMVLNVPLLVDYVGIKYVMSSVFVLLVVPRFRGNLLGSEFRFTQDM